jgi:hypothetical protein
MTERTRSQRLRLELALIFGIPALIAIGLVMLYRSAVAPYTPSGDEDIYAVVTGVWSWEGESGECRDPHRIEFSPDRKVMTIIQASSWTEEDGLPQQTSIYDISIVNGMIRGLIRGETRMTSAGEPVVWDLILSSHDSYYWRQADWEDLGILGRTAGIERCPEGTVPEAALEQFADPERATRAYWFARDEILRTEGAVPRVWGITGKENMFLVADPRKSTVRLVYVVDSAITPTGETARVTAGNRIEIRSFEEAGRSLILVEPLDGDRSAGVEVFEVQGGLLVPIDVLRLALPGDDGPSQLLGRLQRGAAEGSFRFEIDSDLIIDPGRVEERWLCRPEGTATLAIYEIKDGWQTNGVYAQEPCR